MNVKEQHQRLDAVQGLLQVLVMAVRDKKMFSVMSEALYIPYLGVTWPFLYQKSIIHLDDIGQVYLTRLVMPLHIDKLTRSDELG